MSGLYQRLQGEIEAREGGAGLSPIDLLDMPQALAEAINRIIRNNGMRLHEVAQELNQTLDETKAILDQLVTKGFARRIEVKNEIWYKAHFGRKADKVLSLGIWSALGGLTDD